MFCIGVQVHVDLGAAWKELTLVGMAQEAGCTGEQVNALATADAAMKRALVNKPFTEDGSLKPYAPFWCFNLVEGESFSFCIASVRLQSFVVQMSSGRIGTRSPRMRRRLPMQFPSPRILELLLPRSPART